MGVAGRITSAKVAALAGVSQSAVSRAFTPGASVSDETARKVRDAAARLGYRPNALARGLITGRTRVIGLVVANLDNQFYPVALELLSRALQARGYHVLVFMADADEAKTAAVTQELIDHQVDGMITASVAVTSDLTARCEAAGIPVVLFNRGQDDADHGEVTSDNHAGGRRVAEFLRAGGHRRVAHVAGWQGSSTGRDRAAGFLDGMGDLRPVAVVDGRYERDLAARLARQLMNLTEPPDAIFVGGDHMALGVMDELRSGLGLKVPDDVSVVGFDDVPAAAWPAYDLTTLRQPVERMVEETVEMLLARLDGGGPAGKVRLEGALVVRGSARRPPEGAWP